METENLELGGDEAKVFLSYSRKDRERAQRIADVLRERHFGVFKDTDDILPTEEWKDRLEQLIAEADTIVFLLSPHSATSEVCAWEVEHATALNKRIAPIVIDETDSADIPPLLARLNFIFCTERDRFEDAVDSLVSALTVDIEWIREHTRLAGLVARWEKADKPARLLLRGQDIADAEQWRDRHPKDAPEITHAQAAFISDSRRAAARRQRGWVSGSFGVAAATIALAVFAWFQSIEADSQRGEAESQRGIAEQNAAEADRQRNVAEAQRRDALKNLAANRLRSGDRAGGLLALSEANPENAALPVLRAGLQAADAVLQDVVPGDPFILNGNLYQRQPGNGGEPIRLSGFPAAWFTRIGDATALFSDTGAVRLHGPDGISRADWTPASATKPCAYNPITDSKLRLIGVYQAGYSACGLRVVTTMIGNDGAIESTTGGVCEQVTADIANWTAPTIPVETLGEVCVARFLDDEEVDLTGFGSALKPLVPLSRLSFPLLRDEQSIWFANQSMDGETITANFIRDIENATEIPQEARLEFGILNFEDAEAPFYVLPEFASNEKVSVVSGLSIWGGTGGELEQVCHGPTGRDMTCTMFHHYSGFAGYRISEEGVVVLFGEALTRDPDLSESSNAWIATTPDTPFEPMEGLASYGAIRDVAFGPDGRVAMLTEATILVYDAAKRDLELVIPPTDAMAIEWLESGQFAIMSTTGVLKIGTPDAGFTAVRLFSEARMAASKPRHGDTPIWVREAVQPGHLGVGVKKAFVLVDTGLIAPLTNAVDIPDPQIEFGGAGHVIATFEDGSVDIYVNGRGFSRKGPQSEISLDSLTDPDAPIRR